MTPTRAYQFGVRADTCKIISDGPVFEAAWRIESEGLVVETMKCPLAATQFVGRLRRMEAAGN